jgi:hypothetical protein
MAEQRAMNDEKIQQLEAQLEESKQKEKVSNVTLRR